MLAPRSPLARSLGPLVLSGWALAGCAGDATLATEAELTTSATRDAHVVDRRDDRVLLAIEPSTPRPQTDERPSVRLVLRDDAGEHDLGRALSGALTAEGVVIVTPDAELIDDAGHVLDEDVLPELSVRADGRAVAYPHHAGARGGVYVVEPAQGEPRLVTAPLAFADRPLFLEDGTLVVVGARSSGIAGVWLVDPGADAQPRALTNASLRAGRPLGPTFVPPPAFHASMRVEGGTLVYDDGHTERRVALGGAS